MKYRREIDGLRAIAVLPVILFHAGLGAFGGGYAGVDVFFVISGFLIGGIIIGEKEAGTFSLAHFYERRARRILPALFLVMLCTLPFAWAWMVPSDLRDFARSLVAVSTFTSNMLFARQTGYFDGDVELKPLLHTWSLAIEEQYYVFFPLLVMVLWSFGMRIFLSVLLALFAASLAIAQIRSTGQETGAAFFALSGRIWELLAGVFAVLYMRRAPHGLMLRQMFSLTGLVLIGIAIFCFDKSTPFPSVYTLVPVLGAALILMFAQPDTLAGKLLSTRAFVGVGLISYSAYLWHQPVFALARLRGTTDLQLMLVLSVLSLVLAYLSWRFVERPFRERTRFTRRQVFLFALAGSVVFIALGTIGRKTKGFEEYFIAHRLNATDQQLYALVKKHTGGDMYATMHDDGACHFWAKNIDAKWSERFQSCSKTHGKALVVLGDSHAMNLYNALGRTGYGRFIVGLSQGDCRPYNTEEFCQYDDFARFLSTHKQAIGAVIFHMSGSHLMRDVKGYTDTERLFEGEPYTMAEDYIETTVRYVKSLSQDTHAVWLGAFVEARYPFKDFRALRKGLTIHPHVISMFGALDKVIAQKSAQEGVRYISLDKIMQVHPEWLLQGECLTYRDRDHLSDCGELIVGGMLAKALPAQLGKKY